jgi:hypothetical protein
VWRRPRPGATPLSASPAVHQGDGLQRRVDAGDPLAAARLAELLVKRGDVEGLQRRADAGDQHAVAKLAHLLAGWGDVEGL